MANLMCVPRFCDRCNKHQKFLPIHFAAAVTGCNRCSVYRWMKHGWLHCIELPSGRRLICAQSLMDVHEIDLSLLTNLAEASRVRRHARWHQD